MLTFSPAEFSDLEVLYDLNRSLIETYEDLASIDCPKVFAWVRKNLEHTLPYFTRVYYDGILVGYYCLSPQDGKLELDSLFILPPFQGRDIGTAVLERCIAESKQDLMLYVFRRNLGAVKLYQRMGFQIVKELPTRYIMEYKKQGC